MSGAQLSLKLLAPCRLDLATLGRKIGMHEFAYLRAIAEGVDGDAAARLYLGVGHAAEVMGAHRLVVDRIRAAARRRPGRAADPTWRLLGIVLERREQDKSDPPPSLEAWAEAQGLEGWSQHELLEMYAQRYGWPDPGLARRARRAGRLRKRCLALLRELETTFACPAAATDKLDGWIPDELAASLKSVGALTLGDLRERINRGGRWWAPLRGTGPLKAERLKRHVNTLLGPEPARVWAKADPNVSATAPAPALGPASAISATGALFGVLRSGFDDVGSLSGSDRINRPSSGVAPSIRAQDDRQAVRDWIAARCGSAHTALVYEREAERFILFCVLERRTSLADARAADCRAYMDFIANVPPSWISRSKASRLAPGWAPFKGPLSLASQKLTISALCSLYAWLCQAKYLQSSPWALVNTRLGDDPHDMSDIDAASRAFSPKDWQLLVDALASSQDAPTQRLRWLCVFGMTTGLRASELIAARRGDLQQTEDAGWVLRVAGKGRRNRVVPVPTVAMTATRSYFQARGQGFEASQASLPLLAALKGKTEHTNEPLTYRALHGTFTRFVQRVCKTLVPGSPRRARMAKATAHWLRHTHATRFAEGQGPADVLQENLGHSDPRTTARYYRAQVRRRAAEVERVFGA